MQRFATRADLDAAGCTVEEREEYEPHLAAGHVVFAGVDYAEIIAGPTREADVIVWDGGNNDFPFVRPDLHLVVADALRPDDAAGYHPGEAVLRMADVVVVSKVEHRVRSEQVARALADGRPRESASSRRAGRLAGPPRRLPTLVRGRRVLVVEDGPTITHGSMPYGAGFVAATRGRRGGHRRSPSERRRRARAVFARYPHIGPVLPAVGYSPAQLEALASHHRAQRCRCRRGGDPGGSRRLITVSKPIVRARYEFEDDGRRRSASSIDGSLGSRRPAGRGRHTGHPGARG